MRGRNSVIRSRTPIPGFEDQHKTCAVCNAEFWFRFPHGNKSNGNRLKYCSDECQRLAHRKQCTKYNKTQKVTKNGSLFNPEGKYAEKANQELLEQSSELIAEKKRLAGMPHIDPAPHDTIDTTDQRGVPHRKILDAAFQKYNKNLRDDELPETVAGWPMWAVCKKMNLCGYGGGDYSRFIRDVDRHGAEMAEIRLRGMIR